ncbi:MAG: Polyamine aminopropyltransferase [Verrucomicrobiota bacterium]
MSPTTPSAAPAGRHVLAELTGCPATVLNDVAGLETGFRHCAQQGGATLISSHFHHFTPQGVSGVVVIAESHLTVHTWPEHGYAAVDVFTCGRPEVAESVMELIIASLQAVTVHRTSFDRGPDVIAQRLPERR